MERRTCRVCGRSFPSGRSLGGHMRTHVLLSSPMEGEDKPASRYGLRDNPKKSKRFDDAWPENMKDKVCVKSEKVCSSFEMPINDLSHEEDKDWSRGSYKEEEEEEEADDDDEMPNQSDSQVTIISMPARKQRRRSWKDLSSEFEEEKNGALCLLMLSRGTCSVTDLLDKISPLIEFGNKDRSFPCDISSAVPEFQKRSLSMPGDSESGINNSLKRARFMCTICNKSFHSYRALGDHRTGHKKIKRD